MSQSDLAQKWERFGSLLTIPEGVDRLYALDYGPEDKFMGGLYQYECFDKHGRMKWYVAGTNKVVNTGLNDILDQYWNEGSGPALYVGLKDTGTEVLADIMTSHASWATISPYSNATDPQLLMAAASGQSIDNSASKAVFNIDATDEIFGAFVKDSNVVDVATGLLVSVEDFGASRNVVNLDTLNVTITITAADV